MSKGSRARRVIFRLALMAGYDPPVRYPARAKDPAACKLAESLYDSCSPGLKKILDDASADVEKWEPWQRSIDAQIEDYVVLKYIGYES